MNIENSTNSEEEEVSAAPAGSSWAATWIVASVAVIAVIIAVATTGSSPSSGAFTGSGSDSNFATTPTTFDYSTPSTDFSSTDDTTPVTSPPGEVSGGLATWTLSGSDGQGYSAEVTIGVDAPVHISDAETSSVGRAVGACEVNSDTDAVIPVHLQETNTTASFSSILGLDLTPSSSGLGNASSLRLAGDVVFSSGPTCDDPANSNGGNVYGVQWNNPVAAGAAQTDDFFIVVYNYYSPLNPNGDTADLSQLTLAPVITFGDTNSGTDARQVTAVQVSNTGTPPFTISGSSS